MRIKQEELPTIDEIFKLYSQLYQFEEGSPEYLIDKESFNEALKSFIKLQLARIRYEYDQYQFFLEGYKNGSASISEVDAAHNEFLKLLQ